MIYVLFDGKLFTSIGSQCIHHQQELLWSQCTLLNPRLFAAWVYFINGESPHYVFR